MFDKFRRRAVKIKRQSLRRRPRVRPLDLELLEKRLLLALDFGDAPEPYPTLLQDGARHEAIGPTLGFSRDTEANGQPTPLANGDGADEDGVTFSVIRVGQLGASLKVNVQNAPDGAKLDAWIDFNADGTWGGPFEQIADSLDVVEGNNTVRFDIPSYAIAGPTYARFRISTLGIRGPGSLLPAADGEVEDYRIGIQPPLSGSRLFETTEIPLVGEGVRARSIYGADVDGDGDQDFVIAGGNFIAWYNNDGSQNFTATVISDQVVRATTVVVADVDGDADMDVVATSNGNGKIFWYENDGSQNFVERLVADKGTPFGGINNNLFVADMDGDGDVDVVAAEYNNETIAWYENNGNGTFIGGPDREITRDAFQVHSVFAVDVDDDGDLDVVAGEGDVLAWYENDRSQGFFIEHPFDDAPLGGAEAVFAADMDLDGDIDVVVAGGRTIAWYENDINANPTNLLSGPNVISEEAGQDGKEGVFAVDFDGDGDMDVLAGPADDRQIVWYDNDGNQNFEVRFITEEERAVGPGAGDSIFLADMDGDGDLDILSTSTNGEEPDGEFIAWHRHQNIDFGDAPEPYPVLLDDDGASHEIVGPRLGATRDQEVDGQPSFAANGDGLDDDGVAFDPLQVGQLGATLRVFVQNTTTSARLDAWIDFNGDGSWGGPHEQIADNVTVIPGSNTISFDVPSWTQSGQTFARLRISSAGDVGIIGYAPDGEVQDYRITIDRPEGPLDTFVARDPISTSANSAYSVFAADVDGDGDMDVLSASFLDDKIAWYENNGEQNYTERVITEDPDLPETGEEGFADGAIAVFAADVDGDGDVDVLSASYHNDRIAWYENDGDQNFEPREITNTDDPQNPVIANGALSVLAADLDADGDLDVVSASGNDDLIAWYENDGSENFTQRIITNFAVDDRAGDGARSVTVADVNRDGFLDVLSASSADDTIAWYENLDIITTIEGQTEANYDAPEIPIEMQSEEDYIDRDWPFTVGDCSPAEDCVLPNPFPPPFERAVDRFRFVGGSGYEAGDIIFLNDGMDGGGGTVVRVDRVGTQDLGDGTFTQGVIVQFTIESNVNSAGVENGQTLTQSTTDGTGTGFSLTAQDEFGLAFLEDINLALIFVNDNGAFFGGGDIDLVDTDDDLVPDTRTTVGYQPGDLITLNDGTVVLVNSVDQDEGDGGPVTGFTIDTFGLMGAEVGDILTQVSPPPRPFATGFSLIVQADNIARPEELVFDERIITKDPDERNVGDEGFANGANTVFTADADGDGDIDVFSASRYDNKIAWYENDGNQNFTPQVISTSAVGAENVFVADVDGDGDPDVLAASYKDDKIAWHENGGNGVFNERILTQDPDAVDSGVEGLANGARSVFAADLDSDGDLDVLYASNFNDRIGWHENVTATKISVTSRLDSGPGTLREAINTANATPGRQAVVFDIAGDGAHTIIPLSPLPTITDPIIIDGTTEPGFAGQPLIQLNGSQAGAAANGLKITAGFSTVKGLAINRFSGSGIELRNSGFNTIERNFIGTDLTGTLDRGNSGHGVVIINSVSNTIGGNRDAESRNIISGNDKAGVVINGPGSAANTIIGNFIGTDIAGTTAIGNGSHGVLIGTAADNTIGGDTAAERNVISGNDRFGVFLSGDGASANVVQGNYIGVDFTGTVALANQIGLVISDAPNNTIGGSTADQGNVISGNTLHGILINRVNATGNVVQGNLIGTDKNGTAAVGNLRRGVMVSGAGGNTIGGSTTGQGNVISGNGNFGVWLLGNDATNNLVQGNIIGADITGTALLPNQMGVKISGAPGNTIGGTSAAARNLISGNVRHGVFITGIAADGNVVQGNYIGTDITGNTALGNGERGIEIMNAPNTTVGGTTASAGNLISGNTGFGVSLAGSSTTGTTIEGNQIGTDQAGTSAIANKSGVVISGSDNNQIAGNVISGNLQHGVLVAMGSTGNVLEGNLIGTDVAGTGNLGNALYGVYIQDADNRVGGSASGAGNIIAFNRRGVQVVNNGAQGNAIQRNSMFSNTELGIDLDVMGLNANDAGDPDDGANRGQNFPEIQSATRVGANLEIDFSVPSIAPNSVFPITVEFFIADGDGQEGQSFLDAVSYAAPGNQVQMVTIAAGAAGIGTQIVSTATDANGNTSEFSPPLTVAAPLLAAGGPATDSAGITEVTTAELNAVVDAAITRLADQGVSSEWFVDVEVNIADLSRDLLGVSTGKTITIDVDAAGYGWFVDETPLDDLEYAAPRDGEAAGRMDLLTVVMHELGHVAGLHDIYHEGSEDDLMFGWLATGTRRTEITADIDRVFADFAGQGD